MFDFEVEREMVAKSNTENINDTHPLMFRPMMVDNVWER